MKRRVAVTGLGTVNPTGNSVADSWDSIKNGKIGIGLISTFDTTDFKTKVAAEVKDFNPVERLDKKELRHIARFTQLAMYAAEEAIKDAGLCKPSEGEYTFNTPVSEVSADRCGVIVSSGIGGLDIIEQQHGRAVDKGYNMVSPFFVPMAITNMAAARIAISHGFKGMCTCPVTACAGGSNAIGGCDDLRRNRERHHTPWYCRLPEHEGSFGFS